MPRRKENKDTHNTSNIGELMLVEKVLKKRTKNKAMMYYVKWQNLPNAQNSWIRESDVCLLTPSRASNLSNSTIRKEGFREFTRRQQNQTNPYKERDIFGNSNDKKLQNITLENMISFYSVNNDLNRITKHKLAILESELSSKRMDGVLDNIRSRHEAVKIAMQIISSENLDGTRNSADLDDDTISSCIESCVNEVYKKSSNIMDIVEDGTSTNQSIIQDLLLDQNDLDILKSKKTSQDANSIENACAKIIQDTQFGLENQLDMVNDDASDRNIKLQDLSCNEKEREEISKNEELQEATGTKEIASLDLKNPKIDLEHCLNIVEDDASIDHDTFLELSIDEHDQMKHKISEKPLDSTPSTDKSIKLLQETQMDVENCLLASPSSDLPNLMILYVYHNKVEYSFMNHLAKLKDGITLSRMLSNERDLNVVWNVFLTKFQRRRPGICYMRAALEKFINEKISLFIVPDDLNVESHSLFFSFVEHLIRMLQGRIITLDDTIQLIESLNVNCFYIKMF